MSGEATNLSPPPLHGAASGFFPTLDGRTIEIRDVWASNLEEEMAKIRDIVEVYKYVAMVINSKTRDRIYIIIQIIYKGY